jgi:3-polyprenyl-4-hydroxybenzoate decarboxylase
LKNNPIIAVALTGASGMPYGPRLVESLRRAGTQVVLSYSQAAQGVSKQEIDLVLPMRAADVMLKESRKLILVPRGTPFSVLHLENMLKLARAGAVILPANPASYHRPKRVEDLVDFIVARVLDPLGVAHDLMLRWGESRQRKHQR